MVRTRSGSSTSMTARERYIDKENSTDQSDDDEILASDVADATNDFNATGEANIMNQFPPIIKNSIKYTRENITQLTTDEERDAQTNNVDTATQSGTGSVASNDGAHSGLETEENEDMVEDQSVDASARAAVVQIQRELLLLNELRRLRKLVKKAEQRSDSEFCSSS